MRRVASLTGCLTVLLAALGCTTPSGPDPSRAGRPAAAPSAGAGPTIAPGGAGSTAAPAGAGSTAAPAGAGSTAAAGMPGRIEGSVVRFTAGGASVDVTIGADHPAVREFLAMLPLTLRFEEFGGREKIGYLPRKLNTAGAPGSDPENGDLIYFVPWGNLGFYYNTAGIGFSDDVVHIGRYDATTEQLARLEHHEVAVTFLQ